MRAGLSSSPTYADADCPAGTTPTSVPGAGVICIRATDPGGPPEEVVDRLVAIAATVTVTRR